MKSLLMMLTTAVVMTTPAHADREALAELEHLGTVAMRCDSDLRVSGDFGLESRACTRFTIATVDESLVDTVDVVDAAARAGDLSGIERQRANRHVNAIRQALTAIRHYANAEQL